MKNLPSNYLDKLKLRLQEAGVPIPTRQEIRFLELVAFGTGIRSAAREVGFPLMHAKELMSMDHIQETLDALQELGNEDAIISRNFITGMLLESHKLAANSTEQIMAARELGKLWDVYESDKKSRKASTNIVQLTQNNLTINSRKQLEMMTEEELIKLANMQPQNIAPHLLDAEFDEVRDV